ncbi:hypothetical protein [Anaerorhabdus sp.]|uniref:hypothetical protein n=1 Tax=Anaerorhabdus sp. TaxID=1872524 RepID=UPI002FCA3432
MKTILKVFLAVLIISNSYVPISSSAEVRETNEPKIRETIEYMGEKVIFYDLENNQNGLEFRVYLENGSIEEYYSIDNNLFKKVKDDYIFIAKKQSTLEISRSLLENRAGGWSSPQFIRGTNPINIYSTSSISIASILASIGKLPASVFLGVADLILGLTIQPEYVYMDYNFKTYSGCSILTANTNIAIYYANRNNGVWSRGNLIRSDIAGGWSWKGDPSNYSYPAACRTIVSTYGYVSGKF